MHSLVATTFSNLLKALMKIFFMGDFLLGSVITVVVVVIYFLQCISMHVYEGL